MICFINPKTIINFIDNTLKNTDRQRFSHHLSSCKKCNSSVSVQNEMSSLLGSVSSPSLNQDLTSNILDNMAYNEFKRPRFRLNRQFMSKIIENPWVVAGILSVFITGMTVFLINNTYKNKELQDKTYTNAMSINKNIVKDKKNTLPSASVLNLTKNYEDFDIEYDYSADHKKQMDDIVQNGYLGDIKTYYPVVNTKAINTSNQMLDKARKHLKRGNANIDELEKLIEKASISVHKVKKSKK